MLFGAFVWARRALNRPKRRCLAWAVHACGVTNYSIFELEPSLGTPRDKSDYHFRKTATEYDRKSGINWFSCTAKSQSDITLGTPPAVADELPAERSASPEWVAQVHM